MCVAISMIRYKVGIIKRGAQWSLSFWNTSQYEKHLNIILNIDKLPCLLTWSVPWHGSEAYSCLATPRTDCPSISSRKERTQGKAAVLESNLLTWPFFQGSFQSASTVWLAKMAVQGQKSMENLTWPKARASNRYPQCYTAQDLLGNKVLRRMAAYQSFQNFKKIEEKGNTA